jgi:hypothetical protein
MCRSQWQRQCCVWHYSKVWHWSSIEDPSNKPSGSGGRDCMRRLVREYYGLAGCAGPRPTAAQQLTEGKSVRTHGAMQRGSTAEPGVVGQYSGVAGPSAHWSRAPSRVSPRRSEQSAKETNDPLCVNPNHSAKAPPLSADQGSCGRTENQSLHCVGEFAPPL